MSHLLEVAYFAFERNIGSAPSNATTLPEVGESPRRSTAPIT